MKQSNGLPPADKKSNRSIAFQGGTYSLIISAVVLALMVVINILASALPSTRRTATTPTGRRTSTLRTWAATYCPWTPTRWRAIYRTSASWTLAPT